MPTEENYQNQTINVLDKGFVRLVDYVGNDLTVARSARVSYDAEWRAGQDEGSDAKLIRYLWKNKHTSPFEHVFFTFDVKAPIFVFRQWHRHRVWKFSESSGRYSKLKEEYYVPDVTKIGTQSSDNKQVRDIDDNSFADQNSITQYSAACDSAFGVYETLLQEGWARELARMVLPVSTYSHMFASIDLHNLLKFISLRLHPHAQYEIQVYAQAMLDLIRPIVPVCAGAWEEFK